MKRLNWFLLPLTVVVLFFSPLFSQEKVKENPKEKVKENPKEEVNEKKVTPPSDPKETVLLKKKIQDQEILLQKKDQTIRKLGKKLARLELENRVLKDRIKLLKEEVSQIASKKAPEKKEIKTPPQKVPAQREKIEGRVVAVLRASGGELVLLQIPGGREVHIGDHFTLHRRGDFVARVRVEKVLGENLAVLVTLKKKKIHIGDKASSIVE